MRPMFHTGFQSPQQGLVQVSQSGNLLDDTFFIGCFPCLFATPLLALKGLISLTLTVHLHLCLPVWF